MRAHVRADIAVWFAILATAAVLCTRLRPAMLDEHELGALSGQDPRWWWPLIAAAATAAVVIALRGWLTRTTWPAMQICSFAAASAWAASLVSVRHPAYDGAEVGTYLGNALSRALGDIATSNAWLPSVIVGIGGGIAVVLLNAAMQSLSGRVQAQRLAPVLILTPSAALLADGFEVVGLVAVCAVLALSAMASERGRGLLWSTGLGLLSGILLFAGALTGFACTAAGVGMLCIYFLRRRSLMIIVSGLGVLGSLLLASVAIGWSWPQEFGEASALKLDAPAELAVGVILGVLAVIALGGPSHRESWRKVRGTPAWPVMLTGLVAAVLAVLTRPAGLGVIPAAAVWLPLLTAAASAPPRAGGTPEGPSAVGLTLTAAMGIAVAALGYL